MESAASQDVALLPAAAQNEGQADELAEFKEFVAQVTEEQLAVTGSHCPGNHCVNDRYQNVILNSTCALLVASLFSI
jgi:hypothetical protein